MDNDLVLVIGRLEGKIDMIREQIAERTLSHVELRKRQDDIDKSLSFIRGMAVFANILGTVGLAVAGLILKVKGGM